MQDTPKKKYEPKVPTLYWREFRSNLLQIEHQQTVVKSTQELQIVSLGVSAMLNDTQTKGTVFNFPVFMEPLKEKVHACFSFLTLRRRRN